MMRLAGELQGSAGGPGTRLSLPDLAAGPPVA